MPFKLNNPHLDEMSEDMLYHLGISKKHTDFKLFQDVRFICTGGSKGRIEMYARAFGKEYGQEVLGDLSSSDRFCLFKTGFVLWANHGMGVPSLSILFNELFKLLHYAGVEDVTVIRMGTCGGVGVDPGTVIVSDSCLNGKLQDAYELEINGKTVTFPCPLDQELAHGIFAKAKQMNYAATIGRTMCANDFYEGQMRLDGCFNPGTLEEKMQFLDKLARLGVKNIEMECTGFAAMTHRANAKAAIVCVALLNRLDGDQVRINEQEYKLYEMRPYQIVTNFISNTLGYKAVLLNGTTNPSPQTNGIVVMAADAAGETKIE